MNKTKKNILVKNHVTKSKTKKNYSKVMPNLTKTQQMTICKKFPNTYDTFEDKLSKKQDALLKSQQYDKTKELMKINRAFLNIPKSIQPENDFYTWVNYIWLDKPNLLSKKEKYIVQIDDFRLVQDKVYRQLMQIVKEYIQTNHNEKAKQIKNVYEAALKLNKKEQTIDYAQKFVEQIDELRQNKNNLWKCMAFLNENETISYAAPFSWSLNPDDMEPTIMRCFINSPQLSLLDISCYFDDGEKVEYKNSVKTHYFQYLRKLFDYTFGENHGYNVHDVFDMEVQILNFMICEKFKINPTNYNRVTSEESENKYQFNWKEFAKELGFKKTPRFFITGNLNYLNCAAEHLLEEWDSEKWRTYYVYIYIRQMTRWGKYSADFYFDFFGKLLY